MPNQSVFQAAKPNGKNLISLLLCLLLIVTLVPPAPVSAYNTFSDIVDIAEQYVSDTNDDGSLFLSSFDESAYVEWSLAFILYCAANASINLLTSNVIPSSMDATHTANWFKEKDLWTPASEEYVPQRGDIVFFRYGESNSGRLSNHTGIVHHTDSANDVFVIEGCSLSEDTPAAEGVWMHEYTEENENLGYIIGYASPQYPSMDQMLSYTRGDTGYSENAKAIYDFLVSEMGMSHAAACGALGNIRRESGCVPDKVEYACSWENGGGYGLIQWTNTNANGRTSYEGVLLSPEDEFYPQSGLRRTNLVNYCVTHGLDFRSLSGQLAFLQWEMGYYSTYRDGITYMKNCANTQEGTVRACGIWLQFIEGVGGPDSALYQSELPMRAQFAQDYWYSLA